MEWAQRQHTSIRCRKVGGNVEAVQIDKKCMFWEQTRYESCNTNLVFADTDLASDLNLALSLQASADRYLGCTMCLPVIPLLETTGTYQGDLKLAWGEPKWLSPMVTAVMISQSEKTQYSLIFSSHSILYLFKYNINLKISGHSMKHIRGP